jgi:hypothetical protein
MGIDDEDIRSQAWRGRASGDVKGLSRRDWTLGFSQAINQGATGSCPRPAGLYAWNRQLEEQR